LIAAPKKSAGKRSAKTVEGTKRKNYRLRQSKIDRAREILGTSSETETIETALDLVAFGEQLLAGVDRMRGMKLLYPIERDG
jgi:hypothetical protein